jgi:hypothetical protein
MDFEIYVRNSIWKEFERKERKKEFHMEGTEEGIPYGFKIIY